MSHIVTIQTQVRDPVAVAAACERLQFPPPSVRTVRLFSAEATGLIVELPTWRFPVVCHTETGQLEYDNFGGRWGEEVLLQRFLQRYAAEKSTRPQCPPRTGSAVGSDSWRTTLAS